ncbi:MAG: hypothetical protein ACKVTZ_22570, partial [Bacteroidia bacterium]
EYLLRDALFPHGVLANAPDFEQFGVSERGHIFYRNHTLMKLADVASTPQTEQEACVKFEEFRAAVTQKLGELYENDVKLAENNSLHESAIADFRTLFQYLVFRYAEKICDTQSGELKYWQLHYALELPALKELRPKTDIDKGIVPSNTPSLVRQLYEKYKKGVLQGESLSVGIGACGYVVNLDCNYLPISRAEPVKLLDLKESVEKIASLYFQGKNYAVPMLHSLAGDAAASRTGIGNVSTSTEIKLEKGKDYFAEIDFDNKTVRFYLHIYYNKSNELLAQKYSTLKNLWKEADGSVISYTYEGKEEKWTLHYNVETFGYNGTPLKLLPKYEGSVMENNEEKNAKTRSLYKTINPSAVFLVLTTTGDGYSTPSELNLGSGHLKKDLKSFSHELGHFFINRFKLLLEENEGASLEIQKYESLQKSQEISPSYETIKAVYKNDTFLKMQGEYAETIHAHQMRFPPKEIPILDNDPDKYIYPISNPNEDKHVKWNPMNIMKNQDRIEWPSNSDSWKYNPAKFGYKGIPLMAYGEADTSDSDGYIDADDAILPTDKNRYKEAFKRLLSENREIWVFEHKQVLESVIKYIELFLSSYNALQGLEVKKELKGVFYLKRCSRLVFWAGKVANSTMPKTKTSTVE